VVRCPTCAGQVVVPNVETEGTDSASSDRDQLVFERNDFDELLSSGDSGAVALPKKEAVLTSSEPVAIPSVANPPPGAWGTHAEPAYDVEKLNPTPSVILAPERKAAAPGIHLSPARATLLAVVVVILLAISFGAGVLVGLTLKATPQSPALREEPRPKRGRFHPSALARASIPEMLQGAVQRGHIEREAGNVSKLIIS
jgi:hypothetical protein